MHEQYSNREIEILQLLADGAADKEIATQLHLSLNTVKWHNRQIYTKLGVTNRTQAGRVAEELGLLDEGSISQKPVEKIPNNLPAPVSSFVGRENEIEEINRLLESHRLVTLTGPGGVGKTRLALEVANSLVATGRFPDGVYFVELAPISDPVRVGEAILEAVGIKLEVGQTAKERLVLFLKERALLLLVDNYEHLLEGAHLVAELLKESPDLQVLATSREALHLSGEQSFLVPALEIDPSRELFIQRAREICPGFDPIPGELPIIDRICARLDGLPLAIELAAARLPLFSLQAFLESLEDRFQMLTAGPIDAPDRQQTLWDAIDWSYQLLSEEEGILFRRLAVFQGSRTIDAVQEICCFDLELSALDGLASLLDKNLIRQEEGLDGEPRFYLLETLHEYARERLQESAEEQEIQHRHAVYFSELVSQAKYPSRGGPEQGYWLRWLEAEHDNLRAMYEWASAGGDVELGLRVVGSLDYFWLRLGFYDEADRWVEDALEKLEGMPLDVRAGVYISAGMVYYYHHYDRLMSKEMYQQALDLFTIFGEKREQGWAHAHLCDPSEMVLEEREELLDHFEKAVELLEDVDDQVGIAQALTTFGVHEVISLNYDKARAAFEKSLEISREIGDKLREAISLNNLSDLLLVEGDAETAQNYLQTSIKIAREMGYTLTNVGGDIMALAGPALALDQPRRAVVLLGAADALYKRGSCRPQPAQARQASEFQTAAQEQLSQAVYQDYWAKGQAMSAEEAIAFALEDLGQVD